MLNVFILCMTTILQGSGPQVPQILMKAAQDTRFHVGQDQLHTSESQPASVLATATHSSTLPGFDDSLQAGHHLRTADTMATTSGNGFKFSTDPSIVSSPTITKLVNIAGVPYETYPLDLVPPGPNYIYNMYPPAQIILYRMYPRGYILSR